MTSTLRTAYRRCRAWMLLALTLQLRCSGKMLDSVILNPAMSTSDNYRYYRQRSWTSHSADDMGYIDSAIGSLGLDGDFFHGRRSSGGVQHGGRAEALRRFAEERATKTGTTIAGIVFEGGVVLGADTRATGGRTVCDRNCDKIHILAANIACCGAGTSADAMRITEGVRSVLTRMALEMQACLPTRGPAATKPQEATTSAGSDTKTISRVDGSRGVGAVQREHGRVAAAAVLLKQHLFRYQGTVSAALVLGGVDREGPHLYQIQQGGSFDVVEFTAMGSGSLAALSVLESGHREGLTEEDAKELVISAIAAGIDNDLGSGSNIDICVITADRGLEHQRGVWMDPGLCSNKI